jgi:hypothetical protein
LETNVEGLGMEGVDVDEVGTFVGKRDDGAAVGGEDGTFVGGAVGEAVGVGMTQILSS